MILDRSNGRRLLFVHIPRTAGTYIEKHVLGNTRHWSVPDREVLFGYDAENGIMLQHATLLQALDLLGPKGAPQTVFTVVRDPYTRAISLYKYFGGAKKWGSLDAFLLEVRDETAGYPYFYQPQHAYLDQGKRGDEADAPFTVTLLRYENLEDELADFLAENDMAPPRNFRKKMQHTADTEGLLTEPVRELIEHVYADDFKSFGYVRANSGGS